MSAPNSNPLINVDESQNAALNLQVLQRRDSQVMEILGTASHVVVYLFDHGKQEWVGDKMKTPLNSDLFLIQQLDTTWRWRNTVCCQKVCSWDNPCIRLIWNKRFTQICQPSISNCCQQSLEYGKSSFVFDLRIPCRHSRQIFNIEIVGSDATFEFNYLWAVVLSGSRSRSNAAFDQAVRASPRWSVDDRLMCSGLSMRFEFKKVLNLVINDIHHLLWATSTTRSSRWKPRNPPPSSGWFPRRTRVQVRNPPVLLLLHIFRLEDCWCLLPCRRARVAIQRNLPRRRWTKLSWNKRLFHCWRRMNLF